SGHYGVEGAVRPARSRGHAISCEVAGIGNAVVLILGCDVGCRLARLRLRRPPDDIAPGPYGRPPGSPAPSWARALAGGIGNHCGICSACLLDGTAVAVDHALELGVIWAEPSAHVLGVGVLRGGGEAHQVTEENRDDLAFLPNRGRRGRAPRRRAVRAEREVAGEFLGAIRAGGHGPNVPE